ncbi:hypothetical protein D3C80_1846780 [compost metagenome]
MTPALISAANRFFPEVSKNSITSLSANDGELARSITTSAPLTASAKPSPVMVFIPVLGDAAITSCPSTLNFVTVFVPINPVPPMTKIFMILNLMINSSFYMSTETTVKPKKTKH